MPRIQGCPARSSPIKGFRIDGTVISDSPTRYSRLLFAWLSSEGFDGMILEVIRNDRMNQCHNKVISLRMVKGDMVVGFQAMIWIRATSEGLIPIYIHILGQIESSMISRVFHAILRKERRMTLAWL